MKALTFARARSTVMCIVEIATKNAAENWFGKKYDPSLQFRDTAHYKELHIR